MNARSIRVLVVDDEPLGRQRVEDLLRAEPGVDVVGTAGDGDAAIDAIHRLHPDLVFLDVQMPGRTGLEVVRALGDDMPATIFVTAYDQHALAAFDLAAVDYLVKPFDDERFEQALRRARRAIELDEVDRLRAQLLSALGGAPAGAPADARASTATQPAYLERIPVESRGKIRVVNVADIQYITASGPYAELHTAERTHLIRESMTALEEQLDPAEFMRIHRSVIVRLSLVDVLHKGAGGDYEVHLRSGARLRVSRQRREALEARLGVR